MPIPIGLLIGVAISGSLYRTIKGQCSPLARMEPIDPASRPELVDRANGNSEWARHNGFDPLGVYEFIAPNNPRGVLFGWKRRGEGVFMAMYLAHRTVATDFVSVYEGDRAVTTANGTHATLFPPLPGRLRQAFTNTSLPSQWEWHQRADTFVRRTLGLRARDERRSFNQLVIESTRGTAQHVRTIPLWPIRGIWWYATRDRRANIPIEEQVGHTDPRTWPVHRVT